MSDKWPPAEPAADADAVGIDVVVGRVGANEIHRQVHVGDRLGNGELRLAAVNDREDGVASLQQRADEVQIDAIVAREPAATDGPNDGRAVAFSRGSKTSIVSAMPNLRP